MNEISTAKASQDYFDGTTFKRDAVMDFYWPMLAITLILSGAGMVVYGAWLYCFGD